MLRVIGILVLVIVPLTISTAYALRIPTRYLIRRIRGSRIGELHWYEMIYENRSDVHRESNVPFTPNLAGVTSIMDTITVGAPYIDRGVASFVWKRDKSGTIRLLVGVTEAHAESEASVRTLASSIGARIETLQGTPRIPTTSITFVNRKRLNPDVADMKVSDVGLVASAIATTMESAGDNTEVAFVATFEMMRASESKRLEGNINEDKTLRGGSAVTFGGHISGKSSIMATRAARVCIGVGTTEKTGRTGRTLAVNAVNSISTLGWMVQPFDPAKRYQTSALTFGIASTVLVAIWSILGLVPLPLTALLAIPAVTPVILTLARPDLIAKRWVSERMSMGEVVIPPYMFTSLRWRIRSIIRSRRHDAGGENQVSNKVADPSTAQVIPMHPTALYEIVSFPVGNSATNTDLRRDTAQSRGLPNDMVDVPWPIYLGRSGTGQVVNMDLNDLHFSFYTAGSPNSGKTNFLQVIFAGVVKSTMEHHGNLQITPIWGETKGEGAYSAWEIARHDPRALFIDSHNPNGAFRPALEGPRISDGATIDLILRNCTNLVSSFQFSYGDDIKSASREFLDSAFRIAMLLSPQEITWLELAGKVSPDRPNIMDLSFYILGGDRTVDPRQKLLSLYEERGSLPNISEREKALYETIAIISRYLDPKTRKQLEERVSAPLNKLSELRQARNIWTPVPGKQDIFISQIPAHFAPIVVNMGPYLRNDGTGQYDSSISPSVNRRVLLSFNYLLWNEIKASCSGWQSQGKRIPMFFDEVADIAVDSHSQDVPNIIAEALKEGRSRGASYFLGSQFPAQMPQQARQSVLGSRTKFWFNLHDEESIRIATDDMSSGDKKNPPYTQQNIRSLEDGVCVGIMKRRKTITPPFTLHVPYAPEWSRILLGKNLSVWDSIAEYTETQDVPA